MHLASQLSSKGHLVILLLSISNSARTIGALSWQEQGIVALKFNVLLIANALRVSASTLLAFRLNNLNLNATLLMPTFTSMRRIWQPRQALQWIAASRLFASQPILAHLKNATMVLVSQWISRPQLAMSRPLIRPSMTLLCRLNNLWVSIVVWTPSVMVTINAKRATAAKTVTANKDSSSAQRAPLIQIMAKEAIPQL